MGNNGLLRIGELARRAGTTLRTIRYYQQLGLISPLARTKGGFHLYDQDDCRTIEFIRHLQLLGAPLARIKHLLERRRQAGSGAEAAGELIETLSRELTEIEERMATYQDIRDSIRHTLEILRVCNECGVKPSRDVCCRCGAVTAVQELPLPMRAMIAAS